MKVLEAWAPNAIFTKHMDARKCETNILVEAKTLVFVHVSCAQHQRGRRTRQ